MISFPKRKLSLSMGFVLVFCFGFWRLSFIHAQTVEGEGISADQELRRKIDAKLTILRAAIENENKAFRDKITHLTTENEHLSKEVVQLKEALVNQEKDKLGLASQIIEAQKERDEAVAAKKQSEESLMRWEERKKIEDLMKKKLATEEGLVLTQQDQIKRLEEALRDQTLVSLDREAQLNKAIAQLKQQIEEQKLTENPAQAERIKSLEEQLHKQVTYQADLELSLQKKVIGLEDLLRENGQIQNDPRDQKTIEQLQKSQEQSRTDRSAREKKLQEKVKELEKELKKKTEIAEAQRRRLDVLQNKKTGGKQEIWDEAEVERMAELKVELEEIRSMVAETGRDKPAEPRDSWLKAPGARAPLTSREEDLEKRCRDLEAQIVALKSVHKNEMEAAGLHWKEVAKVKSQLELSTRREEVLKDKNVELERQIVQTQKELQANKDAPATVARLEQEMKDKAGIISVLTSRVNELEKIAGQIKPGPSEDSIALAKAQEQIGALKILVEQRDQELLQSRAAAPSEDVVVLKKRIQELEAESAARSVSEEEGIDPARTSQTTIVDLRTELQKAAETESLLREKIEILEKLLRQQEYSDAPADKPLERKAPDQKAEASKTEESLRAKIAEQEKMIARLQESLSSADASAPRSKKQARDDAKKGFSTDQQVNDLKAAIAERDRQIAEQAAEISRLQETINRAYDRLHSIAARQRPEETFLLDKVAATIEGQGGRDGASQDSGEGF